MIDIIGGGAPTVPTQPPSVMNGPGGALGKDEFIKLLLAQMRHQDPLNPMKGEELAVQLAQFSTVEQLMNLNEAFETQQAIQGAMVDAINGSSALGTIGRTVVALGDQVAIPESTSVEVVVGGSGGQATLRVFDEHGNEVGSRALGHIGDGRQTVELGAELGDLPPGTYSYAVEVRDGSGDAVPVQTFVTARVDGVRYGSSGPVLTAGTIEIPLGSIVEIVAGK